MTNEQGLSAEQIAELDRKHVRAVTNDGWDWLNGCNECERTWPCETRQIIDALTERLSRAEATEHALRMKVEGQDYLLRAYRLGTRPPEKAFRLLEKANAALTTTTSSAAPADGAVGEE